MKQLLVLLAVLGVGTGGTFQTGLRVKFKYNGDVGNNSFYEMPRTVGNATAMGWSKYHRPASPLPTLVMYCYNPPHICCLYDPETKYIAGLQIALPLNEFYGQPYDWKIQGFIPWTRTTTNGTVKYMTKQLYFISEATLKKCKEERMEAFLQNKILQEDYIWPVGFHQKRIAVSTKVKGIVNSGFTLQSCIPWMGTHYFYNMTNATECSAETLLNWFMLVDSGKLIGVGMVVIGVMPQKDGVRYHFEHPTQKDFQTIVTNSPDCFVELAGNPTGTTMHIYFIDKPWTVEC